LIDKLIEIGSLEGDGLVSLGGVTGAYLSVGTNNLNTTFSGLIEERFAGARSTLAKTGTGSLTLTGANTYTGGTQIEKGKLVVNNSDGSGTGTDSVGVFGGGQLTGIGRIAGAVIISGPGAFLSPGNHGANPGTLATHSTLSFNANGIYRCALNSKNAAVDEVVANGVAIDGARFGLVDPFGLQLPAGTVLTVIDNTSALPITGTFSNLPDGGTIRVGINIFKANYEGGDGNDLTLTVVQ
jgi:autotransporter-associated beta strand protein